MLKCLFRGVLVLENLLVNLAKFLDILMIFQFRSEGSSYIKLMKGLKNFGGVGLSEFCLALTCWEFFLVVVNLS